MVASSAKSLIAAAVSILSKDLEFAQEHRDELPRHRYQDVETFGENTGTSTCTAINHMVNLPIGPTRDIDYLPWPLVFFDVVAASHCSRVAVCDAQELWTMVN